MKQNHQENCLYQNKHQRYIYKLKITIPAMITTSPRNFLFPIFSFKIKYPITETNTQPLASSTGPRERGTNLYAYTVRRLERKNRPYAKITLKFKYSSIHLSYFRSALFFSIICEIEATSTDPRKIAIPILFLLFRYHQKNSRNDNGCSYHIHYCDMFFKHQSAPYHSPDYCNRFRRVGSNQGQSFDDLLPSKRVESQNEKHPSIIQDILSG